MIGMQIASSLEKICKVHQRAADEASEQRGSYYKVTGARIEILSAGETPEAGNPNQVSSQGELQWLWVS
jgi:hypothetical protein